MTPQFFFLKRIVQHLAVELKRLEWEYKIAEAKAWKRECEISYLSLSTEGRRAADAADVWRRLFGGRRGHTGVRLHDENQHGFGSGPRVCSAAQWDNTVRAMEEDR